MKIQDYFDRFIGTAQTTDEDIAEDFHERITSPFLLSFLISFLIINWEIWVGLFFLNRTDLHASGYKDYIDFINAHAGWWVNLLWPFLSAIVYTFAYPAFREFIRVVRAKITTTGSKYMNSALKDHRVPLEVLIARRKELNSIRNQLTQILQQENDVRLELETKSEALKQFESDLNELMPRYDNLEAERQSLQRSVSNLTQRLETFESLDEKQGGPQLIGKVSLQLNEAIHILEFLGENHVITSGSLQVVFIQEKFFSVKGLPGYISLYLINSELNLIFKKYESGKYSGDFYWGAKSGKFVLEGLNG
jgi:hypothetical protein